MQPSNLLRASIENIKTYIQITTTHYFCVIKIQIAASEAKLTVITRVHIHTWRFRHEISSLVVAVVQTTGQYEIIVVALQ